MVIINFIIVLTTSFQTQCQHLKYDFMSLNINTILTKIQHAIMYIFKDIHAHVMKTLYIPANIICN